MKALKGHSVEKLQSFCYTFQYLLVYQYKTKQEDLWPVKLENDGVSRRASTMAQEATIHMMDTIKKAYPRTESKPGEAGNDGVTKGTQGWKLNKFHELLHIVRCICMFGLPESWIASHGKRHHIYDCKRPATTAQKQHDCFTKQVAERLVDQMVIERAKGEYFLPAELNGSAQQVIAKRHTVNMFPGLVHNGQSISGLLRTVEPCDNGSTVRISRTSSQFYFFLSSLPPQFGLMRRRKPSTLFEAPTNMYLAEFVCSLFFESHTNAGGVYKSLEKFTNLQLHSEMTSEDEMFRAHLNFRREGAWHDWVNVQRTRFVTRGGVHQTKVEFTNPGRVLLFVTYHGICIHPQQQARTKEQSGDDESADSDESSERKMWFYAVNIPTMES